MTRSELPKRLSSKPSYAYKVNIGKGNLSFGLGAGLIMTNTAWSDLVVLDPGDEYLLIDSKVYVVPDLQLRTYYTGRNTLLVFQFQNLLDTTLTLTRTNMLSVTIWSDYYYLFNTGYLFDTSSNFQFFPSALVVVSPGENIIFDINAYFRVMDRFWFGASYRNNRSISGMFQFQLNEQIKFAYSYDFDFAELQNFSSGSHEVMLRYEFRYKVDAISPLNF